MEQEMLTLYQTITAALPNIDHPSVLFVGISLERGHIHYSSRTGKNGLLANGKDCPPDRL